LLYFILSYLIWQGSGFTLHVPPPQFPCSRLLATGIKVSKRYWYWVWQPIKVLPSTQYYPILESIGQYSIPQCQYRSNPRRDASLLDNKEFNHTCSLFVGQASDLGCFKCPSCELWQAIHLCHLVPEVPQQITLSSLGRSRAWTYNGQIMCVCVRLSIIPSGAFCAARSWSPTRRLAPRALGMWPPPLSTVQPVGEEGWAVGRPSVDVEVSSHYRQFRQESITLMATALLTPTHTTPIAMVQSIGRCMLCSAFVVMMQLAAPWWCKRVQRCSTRNL